MTLWEVDIYPGENEPDPLAAAAVADAAELQICDGLVARAATGYLLEGELSEEDAHRAAKELLADAIAQTTLVAQIGDAKLSDSTAAEAPPAASLVVHVLPKPGVMDPVAQSALGALTEAGLNVTAVRTFKKYWLPFLSEEAIQKLAAKSLANDAIEQVIVGPLRLARLDVGSEYSFQKREIAIRDLDDAALEQLSKEGQLYLTLVEMRTIQQHFRDLRREPTDVELETIAQTWSEHCSHKTLAGRISYRDENGERQFTNMLKETIFAATQEIKQTLGEDDWLVSVFKDNAGVVTFDDHEHACFKVETHNHPSALEPYGGANTGVGGVIRDILGVGLGARLVANTDVFCFADPNTPADNLPPGVLHPRRVMKGVVSGVRDYGNRMGIPTVNGAICFDPAYLGNPLVFCGAVGMLPRDKVEKAAQPGDWIVTIGGRTGRDGIHGATFSSAELTHESETLSGGAVQIGNAITEKMVADVLLAARDRGLYTAVTDCGAGGFSSAVGEMGEKVGAKVQLEKAPLKYSGLSYDEIWISEAQERMVLAVPPQHWQALQALCDAEGVEATVIGTFENTGRLKLTYQGHEVADLDMRFLHDGRPPVVREAVFRPRPVEEQPPPQKPDGDYTQSLLNILASPNVCSKEWVIRQYDHEVQGGSVIKPLVGEAGDGPGDAAVIRPRLDSRRGLVLGCGLNPRFGRFDTYHMAASAIDEAIRNCVAVGANPARIALLDNFCWGYTDRPETLGSLTRAAIACHDMALALATPFISGKDSLNNEFSYFDSSGNKQTIAILPTLLISALGQVDDVEECVTMDLKDPDSYLYLVGQTHNEMAGSHFHLVEDMGGGRVPRVRPEIARETFARLHAAIRDGLVSACHDLSEGGLAVAAAEMAFAGGVGAVLTLTRVPMNEELAEAAPETANPVLLFSESNSRFLVEVPAARTQRFEERMEGLPLNAVGQTQADERLVILGVADAESEPAPVIDADLGELKTAWRRPLTLCETRSDPA